MSDANTWLLPDGVADVLPQDAMAREQLRRDMVDVLVSHGYQLVDPPLVEYTESLLSGASESLKRQTFRIVDQLTGRLMGVRADITPQVARIDAHVLPTETVSRYCYAAPVLHTRPKALYASRTPFHVGAELYGHAGISADIEILDLLMTVLSKVGVYQEHDANTHKLHIDLGNVAIFSELADLAELNDTQKTQLLNLYERKALPELQAYCADLPMGNDFYQLGLLSQDIDAFSEVLSAEAKKHQPVMYAIYDLKRMHDHMQRKWPACHVSVDVAELSSYHYHTGMVFSLFGLVATERGEQAVPLVQGGRYGKVGSQNVPQQRPATGFSCDIGKLLDFSNSSKATQTESQKIIAAPALDDDVLAGLVKAERAAGHIVVNKLSEADVPQATHQFLIIEKQWQLVELAK